MVSKIKPNFIVNALVSIVVWSSIICLPLFFTFNKNYEKIFPSEWYDKQATDYSSGSSYPSPLGLSLGILAVAIGQIFTLIFFISWKLDYLPVPKVTIQKVGPPAYEITPSLKHHLAQPEGFVMLGGYLILTWMYGIMPASYYSFSGGINWTHVFLQLLIQDFIQFIMHFLEHVIHPYFYRLTHKPHHRFINPKIFDAFNGSFYDTLFMILIPLVFTARIVPANVWSYMTFGSLYANWLTLIHSEFHLPWDGLFYFFGFGTAGDHHVHHKLFKFNFAHLFTYWDRVSNTYRSPKKVELFSTSMYDVSK